MGNLIVTRQPRQSVRLRTAAGERITVTVVEFKGAQHVRLAIQAPESVSIERDDITDTRPIIRPPAAR